MEIISEIKKLPATQRKRVLRFVDEELRHAEDVADNAAADRALAEPGDNIPWSTVRERSLAGENRLKPKLPIKFET